MKYGFPVKLLALHAARSRMSGQKRSASTPAIHAIIPSLPRISISSLIAIAVFSTIADFQSSLWAGESRFQKCLVNENFVRFSESESQSESDSESESEGGLGTHIGLGPCKSSR